jgi:hypothetical protein
MCYQLATIYMNKNPQTTNKMTPSEGNKKLIKPTTFTVTTENLYTEAKKSTAAQLTYGGRLMSWNGDFVTRISTPISN